MSILLEIEHQLRHEAKVVQCVHGHTVATHTTDSWCCTCGLEIWSRDGRMEALVLHAAHLEFVRQKQQAQAQAVKARAASVHEIRLNDTKDCARCSECDWCLQSSSLAVLLVGFSNHIERVKDATL